MSPAEALGCALRNTDDPRQVTTFDVMAASDVLRRLGDLGWRLIPAEVGITLGTTEAATDARLGRTAP